MKRSTDIDQTNHLFELGYDDSNCRFIQADRNGPAAFTISDFLEILPPFLEEDWHNGLEFQMYYDSIFEKWYVGYFATSDEDRGVRYLKDSKELIDALYELTCWFSKHILKLNENKK